MIHEGITVEVRLEVSHYKFLRIQVFEDGCKP